MGLQLDVGDGSTGAGDLVTVAVNTAAGDSIVVANNAASPASLNVYANGIDQAPTVVSAGSNTTVTTPTVIQAVSGVCTVKLTGGQYGS